MKKLLNYFLLSIIIAFTSNNYSFGQEYGCYSLPQTIESVASICVNSGNTITGKPNYVYEWADWGLLYDFWWNNDITVKRPDGSTALVIQLPHREGKVHTRIFGKALLIMRIGTLLPELPEYHINP